MPHSQYNETFNLQAMISERGKRENGSGSYKINRDASIFMGMTFHHIKIDIQRTVFLFFFLYFAVCIIKSAKLIIGLRQK